MISLASLARFPGLRVIVAVGPTRLLRAIAILYVAGFTVAVALRQEINPFAYGADTVNYLAAGERLNVGNPLYALSLGDRAVPINPPYWTVPILTPPPLLVVWRLGAVVGDAAVLAWWVGGWVAVLWLMIRLVRYGSGPVLIAVVALTPALVLTANSGNVAAYMIPALAAAWWHRTNGALVGAVIGGAAAVKVAPILLLMWLATHRRRSAIGSCIAGLVAAGVLGLAGAGAEAYMAWADAARASAPFPLSLAGLVGLPSMVTGALVSFATVLVAVAAALRGREDVAFAACVCGAMLATPTFYFAPLAGLAASMAPWAERR